MIEVDSFSRKMPAPTRNTVMPQAILQSSVMAKQEEETPVIIRQVGQTTGGDDFLARFTEVIMFGGAMLAIWTGLLGIAFSDDATNWNYLILFIGGFVSAGIALAMVEFHGRKNENVLMPSQNYILGVSFFFMAVGLLWGIRFIAGWLTFEEPLGTFSAFGAKTALEGDWVPNANLIYAQTAGAIVLVLGQIRLLHRYSGELTFSWTVAASIPLALLLVGVGPWIDYSNSVVSYELGSAIVLLTSLAMWVSIQSNKSITFTAIASVCGIIPLIYELMNENAPADGVGGALSLMVFIIIIQGYLATSPKLNQKLMERTSFILIGEVVLAMLVANNFDANAILGPIRMSDTAFADTLTLPVILWFVTLAAYFPAVHANRVPAMPIGLAFALWTLNGDEAILPWITAVLMVVYMLFFAKVTRKWVANFTISALSIAYLISDLLGYGIDAPEVNLVIAISLIAIAWTALRMGKIDIQYALQSLVCVAITDTILNSEYWVTGWAITAFLLFVVFDKMRTVAEDDFIERRNATLSLITTMFFTLGLILTGKMNIPYTNDLLSGASIEFVLLGVLVYVLFFSVRKIELDFGELLHFVLSSSTSQWKYSSEHNAWVKSEGDDEESLPTKWGELARFSLIFSLISITVGFATINTSGGTVSIILPLLLALPIGLLLHQVMAMDSISSYTRFIGAVHLLFIALFSAPMLDELQRGASDAIVIQSGLLHDILFLAAPLIVNALIIKRGLDEEGLNRTADNLMMGTLLLLGCFDASGGLLFLTMFGLVAYQSLKYRLGVLTVAPLVFVFTLANDLFGLEAGLMDRIFDGLGNHPSYYLEERVLWFGRFTGFLTAAYMLTALAISLTDVKNEEREIKMPWVMPFVWFLFAMWASLPDAAWLPLVLVTFAVLNAWYRGDVHWMTGLSIATLVSWIIGFSDALDTLNGEIFSLSMFYGGLQVTILAYLASQGKLTINHLNVGEEEEEALKKKLSTELRYISLGALLLSFDAFNGLGMLIASIWATFDVVKNGEKISLLFLPLLHGLTLGNVLYQFDVADESMREILVGILLGIEGVVLLGLSIKEDTLYDLGIFTWDSNDEFFEFVERLGIAGTLSAIVGVWYGFSSQAELAFILLTVLLASLAITGFNEKYHNVRWRRALGVYGSMLSGLMFYTLVDNDLYANLTIVGLGLLALGYGFVYLQFRSSIQPLLQQQMNQQGSIPQMINTNDESFDVEDETSIEDDEVEPALTPSSEDEFEEEDDSTSLQKKNRRKNCSKDGCNALAFRNTEFCLRHQEKMQSTAVQQTFVPETLIETTQGFALRLPPGTADQIIRSIELTPHDGFKPVLELNAFGKLQLHFEPE